MTLSSGLTEPEAFDRALAALGQDRAGEALAAADAALSATPSARLWQIRALALRDLDRRREALAACAEAQALAPTDARITLGLAQTRFEAGLPSVDDFARAAQLQPNDPDILLGLGHALMAEGRVDDAVAGMTALLRGSPQWVGGQEFLAHARFTAGERDGFASGLIEALRQAPANLDLRRAAIQLLHSAGQDDAALALIAQGERLLGDQPLFALHRAIIAADAGDLDAADPLFERVAGFDDPVVQVRRMRFLIQAHRPEPALTLFERYRTGADASHFLPYATIAWRWLDDPQWARVEGDERLVGVFDLGERLPPLNRLAAYLRSVHKARSQQLDQSVRGGTQTEGNILSHVDPLIEQTAAAVREAVASYVAQLPPPQPDVPVLSAPRDRRLRFAGSWSVLLRGGGYHSNHIHPMGWISSALYVDLPAAQGTQGWLTLGEPQQELATGLAPFRTVEPRPGRLVLFPSTMWHGTVPFEAGERLTIAFDVSRPPSA